MSAWCVSVPSDTRFTAEMLAASGVLTLMLEPYDAEEGAAEIVGRGPLNR